MAGSIKTPCQSGEGCALTCDSWCAGELDATKANAATLVAQLQLETADKQQLSTKLADSESIKNELEAKVGRLVTNIIIVQRLLS